MKFQLILCLIFCKRKLHSQSKEKRVGNRNASAILEISGKLQRRNEGLPRVLCVVRFYKMAPVLRTCGEFRGFFEFDFLGDEALIRGKYT